jgi:triacylglycerol lipase
MTDQRDFRNPDAEALYSSVPGPLQSFSVIEQSLVLAELAKFAYRDLESATRMASAIGFPQAMFFDRDGTQAYRFSNEWDTVISVRGTEPDDFNDLAADANAIQEVFGTLGRVHRGFNEEADDLWPMIERAGDFQDRQIWFAGHSLGGAVATICAFRCVMDASVADPRALFTYGSPRVGCSRYIRHANLTHYRWVCNSDPVPTVPPKWMGYRHFGIECYLDCEGCLRQMDRAERRWDAWRGIWAGLRKRRFDPIDDHRIDSYISAIAKNVGDRPGSLVRRHDQAHGKPAASKVFEAPTTVPYEE